MHKYLFPGTYQADSLFDVSAKPAENGVVDSLTHSGGRQYQIVQPAIHLHRRHGRPELAAISGDVVHIEHSVGMIVGFGPLAAIDTLG